uniref:Nonstructural protein P3 n=1 Tax=Macrostomum lignano TaxID=282301 RepID=A0A1I8FSN9_9PLAT
DFFSLQGDVHTSAAVGQNITQAAGRLAEFGRQSEMSAVSPPALAGSIVSSPSSTLAEAAAGGSGPSSASWMASRGRFRLTGLAGRSDGFRPLVAEPILEEESDYEAPEDSHSEPDAPL